MKLLIKSIMPNDTARELFREERVEEVMGQIMAELEPEAVYLVEQEGKRASLWIVEVEDETEIPRITEPFFLGLNAKVEVKPVMAPEVMETTDFREIFAKWG